ncbi:MAG: hypothetical protein M3401_08945 [Actinomycetota bacterium]|nr:hypothetical protein [Actinomycetota bacterium]
MINTTDGDLRRGVGVSATVSPGRRRRRTMGLCAQCHRPVEFDQEHLRLHRMFWHVECALAAHEPATD